MSYPFDPAWSMPEQNWQPTGSFQAVAPVPASAPDAGTTLCLPPLNQEWLILMLGCVDQLLIPATWGALSDAAMNQVLSWAELLKTLIASAGACEVLAFECHAGVPVYSTDGGATWTALPDCFIGPAGPAGAAGAPGPAGATGAPGPASIWRLSACDLQYSNDAGATWTTTSGWSIADLQACLSGQPGNPQGVLVAQQACNIAGWLAVQVLQGALSNMATSMTAGATLFDAVKSLGGLALGLTELLDPFVLAAAALFEAAVGIGATALNAAAADATLKASLICAIYTATSADGKVTPGNFAAVVANITGIAYGTPAIVGLLANFVTGLGYTGLNAIQAQGSLYNADCSACTAPPGESALYLVSTANNAVALASDLPTGGSFTVGGWWFPLSIGPGTEAFLIMGHAGGFSNQVQLYEDTTHHLAVYADNGVGGNLDLHSAALVTGGAHHIALSRSGSTATLWLDGVSVATGALPGGSFAHAGGASAFGGDGSITQELGGELWRWAYYASAFSAAQMLAWYGNGHFASVPAGAAHSWLFGEGAGVTVSDAVGGNNGTVTGPATWVTHA